MVINEHDNLQRIKLMLKLLELKTEYENNPQLDENWRKQMFKALRNEADEQARKRLDSFERMLDFMEMMKAYEH